MLRKVCIYFQFLRFFPVSLQECNRQDEVLTNGRCWYDHVNGIDYNGYQLNLAEYAEEMEKDIRKGRNKEKNLTRIRMSAGSFFVRVRSLPGLKVDSEILEETCSTAA